MIKKPLNTFLAFTLILCTITCCATSQKLTEVNAEWKNHSSFLSTVSIDKTPATETALIQLHLTLVEQHIRASIATSALTAQQKQRKHAALDEFRQYIAKAEFPINQQYNYRTPIFIDAYNNFCAVGYLLKQTGQEVLARKISKEDNLIYVRQIKSNALMAWAIEYGFSVDELAWIQPTYLVRPKSVLAMIGGGVNDEVNTLYLDSGMGHLYVGGDFSLVNTNRFTWGIGRYNLIENSWDSLTYNADGPIHKILNFRDTLFIGGNSEIYQGSGSFWYDNIAMVVNDTLRGCGQIKGTVYDMIEYNGSVYAAGNFTSGNAKNVVKWNGKSWVGLAGGTIDGTILSMTVYNNKLILAGEFSLSTDSTVKNIVAYGDSGYVSLGANFGYRVNDVEVIGSNLYAATDITSNYGESGIWVVKDNNGNWVLEFDGSSVSFKYGFQSSFTMLKSFGNNLIVSGKFELDNHYPFGFGHGVKGINLMKLNATYIGPAGMADLDDAVNDIVQYGNKWIIGGSFSRSTNFPNSFTVLNGLAFLDENPPTGITDINELTIGLYPNPASASITITLPAADNSATANIYNLQGQWVQSHTLTAAANTLELGDMPAGMYVVQVVSGNGIGQKRLVKY